MRTPYSFAPANDRKRRSRNESEGRLGRALSMSAVLASSWKLHSVTICRELRHSDQIIKSEHGGTDPQLKNRTTERFERLAGQVLAIANGPLTGASADQRDGRPRRSFHTALRQRDRHDLVNGSAHRVSARIRHRRWMPRRPQRSWAVQEKQR